MSAKTPPKATKKERNPPTKSVEPQSVTLTWNLIDLPTAQHKAGLAGLVLAVRSLQQRSTNDPEALPPEEVPTIVSGPDAMSVAICFTRKSHARLIDDVYDADPIESEPRENPRFKGKGADKKIIEPFKRQTLRVKSKAGIEKEVSGYVYLDAIPRFTTIRSALGENKLWLKLWHDFLKNVVRDSKKWSPYRLRAAAKSPEAAKFMLSEPDDEESKDTGDGGDEEQTDSSNGSGTSWTDLLRIEKSRGKKAVFGNLSSALLLGAQAVGPERLSFKGRIEQNLLLHFWPLVVMPTVPWLISRDGKSEETGYVVAIPEVSELDRFCNQWPRALHTLSPEPRGNWRPAQAVIDLPAQGALEFANTVARIKSAEQDDSPMRSVAAVEFLHLDRQGNNVKLLASGRVFVNEQLLHKYRDIVGPPARYHNPLFRAALIQALLRDKPWWAEMLSLFMAREWRFFVQSADNTRSTLDLSAVPFWADVRERLNIEYEIYNRKASNMESRKAKPLPILVNNIVRTYVLRRAETRSGITLAENVDWATVPKKFKDERTSVAQNLFLEFRSRRDQAFVDHFAQTFFATPQWMSDEDQQALANALVVNRQVDDVKTLTLMALSANS